MQWSELGEERDPLQNAGVFGQSALEPPECFFFVAECNVNRGDRGRRDIASLALPHEFVANLSSLRRLAHPNVSDGKAGAREMPDILRCGIKLDRFRIIAVFPVGGSEVRIQ